MKASDPGKYLGIPSVWGLSKKEAFDYLKGRIGTRFPPKTLNHASKGVLIKSTITVIPSYAMSVFNFPKTCFEINAMIAGFW